MSNETNIVKQELKIHLEKLDQTGIQADKNQLMKDMCSQFSDVREYSREYAVNAYDAGARHFYVTGYEDEDTVTVIFEDDGHGMDRQGVIDFHTIYRSVKKCSPAKAIGSHGIGKLSVAAVPGQIGFVMTTSTGKESWQMKTGNLMDNAPIRLEAVSPVLPQGTRFEIVFKKTHPISEELRLLAQILERYLKYLPLKICVFELDEIKSGTPEAARVVKAFYGSWEMQTERFSRSYAFELNSMKFNVVMGLGPELHEIYQNQVLISAAYNLLFFDMPSTPRIPHLKIRIDSPDFKLPFGRHCLRNEDVLKPLAEYLRENILRQYIQELFSVYENGLLKELEISLDEIQDIACALIGVKHTRFKAAHQLPIFNIKNQPRASIDQLRQTIEDKGKIYLESPENTGVDTSFFNAPVLSLKQPLNGLELIETMFKGQIVNLGKEDVILPARKKNLWHLKPSEKKFQNSLGFHSSLISKIKSFTSSGKPDHEMEPFNFSSRYGKLSKKIEQESNQAQDDLADIKWQVDHLVHKDGKTPCLSHRFILDHQTVILNLHHEDIQELVRLAEISPELSGHYALAMCLSEEGKILPFLSPEAREDLILMDAMSRCGSEAYPDDDLEWELPEFDDSDLKDFMVNLDDHRRWLE